MDWFGSCSFSLDFDLSIRFWACNFEKQDPLGK